MNTPVIIIFTLSISCIFYFYKTKRRLHKQDNLMHRFRKSFQRNNRIKTRFNENLSNSLLIDPSNNIEIGIWDEEDMLREKADIHKSRLIKYGKSKMNGEMLFMDKNKRVYKYTNKQERKYI